MNKNYNGHQGEKGTGNGVKFIKIRVHTQNIK